MEKSLDLGPETKATLDISAGKVRIGLSYGGTQANAGLFVEMNVEQYAKLLKDAIPGTIDDAIIDVLVAAMKVI